MKPGTYRLHLQKPLDNIETFQRTLEGLGIKILQPLKKGSKVAEIEGDTKVILGLRDQLQIAFDKIETLLF